MTEYRSGINSGSDSGDTTNQCRGGYYCETGATTDTQYSCSLDVECPAGETPNPCDAGYYTEGIRQSTCVACPDGDYCAGQGTNVPCEAGYIC